MLSGDGLLALLRQRLDPIDAADSPMRGDGDLNGMPSPSGRILRPAAVLAPLILHDGPPRLLFTERATHLTSHAGQISFPGGSLDPGDAGPADAALREVEEEIGIAAQHVDLIGRFEAYETGTGFHITPFVGILKPGYVLRPDPGEVAGIFETPFDFLMDPRNHQRDSKVWQGHERHFYAMPWEDRYIWGVTAGLLKSLHDKLYG
tara:strand:- start:7202 stop:7816 length:615 start_codon:yes stop_codon:yes gene_type:complete